MSDDKLNESVWRRAYSDTTLLVGTIWWGVLAAAGGAALALAVDPVWGVVWALGSYLLPLAFHLVIAPLRQRDEARGMAKKLRLLEGKAELLSKELVHIEAERDELLRTLMKACPIWFHEESGATIVGKVGGPIQVQGGSFPWGLIPNGSNIQITGTSQGR